MKVWLDRLAPEYRRRYYINIAILAGLFLSFIVIGRLGPRDGAIAVGVLMAATVLFSWIYPLVRLIRARPGRVPFLIYAAWISAYAYFGVAFFVPWLPAVPIVLILGGVLMCAFYVIYRKIIFPDFFGGKVRARWHAIREAQKAEREANTSRGGLG